jgi:hypothetical protein
MALFFYTQPQTGAEHDLLKKEKENKWSGASPFTAGTTTRADPTVAPDVVGAQDVGIHPLGVRRTTIRAAWTRVGSSIAYLTITPRVSACAAAACHSVRLG